MKPRTKWFLVATCFACLLFTGNSLPGQITHAQTVPESATESFWPSGAGCDRVIGTAAGQATSATTFATRVTLAVRGGNFGGAFGLRFLTAASTASIIEQQPGEGGAINAVTSHVFEITGRSDGDGKCEPGEDCFTTLDRAVLTPTEAPGKFRLTSKLGIINGYGAFRKLCGRLEVSRGGAIDFTATPPTVRWEVTGNFCQCKSL